MIFLLKYPLDLQLNSDSEFNEWQLAGPEVRKPSNVMAH